MEIQSLERDKTASCLRILDLLPDWFAQREAREAYACATEDLPLFGCFADGHDPVGILSLKIHNRWNAEIHVMGVLPAWHRRGVGTLLMRHAERHARKNGIHFLTVKTLSAQSDDPCYDRTRKFYLSTGFHPFEELPTLWGRENPCLLMIKQL